MRTIHKYPLLSAHSHTLQVRAGARPLRVDRDPGGHLCLWAEVDDEAPLEPFRLYVAGTGTAIPLPARRYISTVIDAVWVWHYYTEAPPREPSPWDI